MRKLFKKSKWIHKWFGLILILFLIWMSASGILMNHPEWIAGISVPHWMAPPQYTPENWNRSALIDLVYDGDKPHVLYAAGKQGIWRSTDGGHTFHNFERNFESSWFYKKTKDLYLTNHDKPFLLAATDGGLYYCETENGQWRHIPLGENREAVRKILKVDRQLLVFSESNVYASKNDRPPFHFKKLDWRRSEPERRVTLIDLFFHLHDGRVLGLPGKLLFDFAGLVIIFLSISAFYIWFFPKRIRQLKAKRAKINVQRKSKVYRLMHKYHYKLGIWLALILFIIGGTGFFMRPPVLALIAEGSVPAAMYPGLLPENPWHKTINNALYDAVEKRIIVNAKDGNWIGPADFSAPFEKKPLNVPIFVMGATVFEPYGRGGFLVGSFNGLFHLERDTGRPYDFLNKKYADEWSNVRPADQMVTGYFESPNGKAFVTTHEQGLLPVSGKLTHGKFAMPNELKQNFRLSLWNFMFELHNGRIFKDWIGGLYILLVPLGSLLFVLITASGVYDWTVLWLLKRKPRRKN